MELFREQLESYKEKVGKEKAKSTYLGLVADYKSALLFLKDKKNVEDIALDELDKDFIEDYYNWMLGTCGSASSTAFGRVNTMKWLMHIAQEKGLIKVHPFTGFGCKPGYKRRSFLSEEELQRLIHVELRYKRQQAMRDMLLFMCFTGLAFADLKAITYKNIHTDSDGGTWLMGNRIKTGVAYVVKLLPIAIELVEKYISVKNGVRPTTMAGYGTVINLLKKDPFGRKRIDTVKISDAKAWLIKLQQKDGKSYSSIHTIRGVLRPAFQLAVDDDLIRKNPFGFQLVDVVINDSIKREAISREEERKFMKFIKEDAHYCRYYDGMYILFKTGLRISEFCGLTLSDIDFKNHRINVDHHLQKKGKHGYYIEETKTASGTRGML